MRNRYDIIHYHLGGLGILFIATLFNKKAKVIHHIHSGNIVGNVESNKLSLIQKCFLFCTKKKTLKIAVSEKVRQFYQNEIRDNSEIFVVNNFSNFAFQGQKHSLKYGIGFLGRIVKEKGFVTYVNIIDELRSYSDKYKFYAKGDIYSYEEDISELENGKKLKFFSSSFFIEELFNEIDLLIFPSTAPEAFPLVLIEAISFDVGVIALRSDNINAILGDYPLIVDELKSELFINNIHKYYSNQELRRNLSQIHQQLSNKYLKEKSLNHLESLYDFNY